MVKERVKKRREREEDRPAVVFFFAAPPGVTQRMTQLLHISPFGRYTPTHQHVGSTEVVSLYCC
jgi:hypothetical protein